MAELGYGGPKIKIFNNVGTLLNESAVKKSLANQSLKHLITSLKTVQRETNEFLTTLVQEQISEKDESNRNALNKGNAELEEEDDEEDDEDDNDDLLPKRRKKE